MIKVGITGGIGSGKSTVCKVFELLGVPVYNSDWEAKKIQNEDAEVKAAILKAFGENLLNDKGMIDRTQLAAVVFNDKDKLQKLNSIVHPSVARHFDNWLELNKSSKYVIKEAAILIESGIHKTLDKMILVVAPFEIRLSRAIKRDNISEDLVKQRINSQLSDEEKIKFSHFIIYNDEQQLLIPQIMAIHEQLSHL
jgi:dephospho-CoA kinase